MKPKRFLPILCLALLFVSLPYVVAAISATPDAPFGGFLLNPLDGNSYLAKMHEGWQGTWTFRLPFTAQPGEGSYLFLFYLFLGHLARWTHVPLLWMFHIARMICGGILVFTLARFFRWIFKDEWQAENALVLAVFGSGLGWCAAIFGGLTSDFWVAEAYPFLAMYSNPHFPLALALALILFMRGKPQTFTQGVVTALLSLLLAVIQPFGVVVVGITMAGLALWNWIVHRKAEVEPILLVALGGAPMMLYQYWLTQTHPTLMQWNAQNLTPSPAVWDLAISLLPALALAVFGVIEAVKTSEEPQRLLVVWLILGLVLMYLPIGLQRRFMLGLFIPTAGLAVAGLRTMVQDSRRRFRRWMMVVMILSIPTNVLILSSGIFEGIQRNSQIDLRAGEITSFDWLSSQPQDAVVLAAPETGLLIPAYTGQRVVYGHPYETVHAAEEEKFVTDFFRSGKWTPITKQTLMQKGVTLIYVGSRERSLGDTTFLDTLPRVYDQDGVMIYAFQTED